MSQRFNPRYIFKHTRSESIVTSMTGVREDDFLRILSLCEQSFGEPLNPRATGEEQHRREQAETIAILRNGGYTVNNKGEITVVYEQYDSRRQYNQPLSVQRVESILTTAFLVWSDDLDPHHQILSRLNVLKSPRRYGYLLEEGECAPLSIEDQRFHYLFTVLKERLDAPRMARYSHWHGAKRGWFARVIDMEPKDVATRIANVKDRHAFHLRMEAMFADMRAAKDAREAVAA